MDFDILDIIEQATTEADAFENHPMCEFSMEEQVLYLNGLALVMNADGHIDDSEKEYIRILIKSIGLDESSLEDMVAFAKAPDKDTVQAFFRAFRRKPIAQLFLFDALMMTRRDGKVEEKEIAVVNKIAEQLEILKGTQQDIFDLFCHIKNRNWQESALYFSSHLLNPEHFKHLLAYHELSFEGLMEETENIRNARLLDVIKNKMSEVEAGENVKVILDAGIVLPMLQAEVDRGNAQIINNCLALKDSVEFGELSLDSIGFTWDKESLSIHCKENTTISNSKIVQKFSTLLNLGNMLEAIDLLYLGRFEVPIVGQVAGERTINLRLPLLPENLPYIVINDNLFKYTPASKYNSYNSRELYLSTAWDTDQKQYKIWYNSGDSDSKGYLTKVDLDLLVNKGLPIN